MASEPAYVERFTPTERALHWVHAAAFLALLATGLVLYVPRLSILVGRRPLLKDLHVYTAVGGHLYLALIYPATRHSLRGMTSGYVRRDWAERHHPKWAPEQRQ